MRWHLAIVATACWMTTVVGGVEAKPRAAAHNYASGTGRAWVESAVAGAAAKLAEPTCRLVLSDFSDRNGVSLDRTLDARGVTPEEYVTSWIWFMDGSGHRQCQNRDIAAFTETGSRLVYVCSSRVVGNHISDGDLVIIHEMLHSLGLPENPPTPAAITRQIVARCRG